MKKVSIYLGIIVALFVLLYVVNQQSEKSTNSGLNDIAQELYHTNASKLNPLTRDQLQDENYQHIIIEKDLDRKLADKETFFAYYFSPACSHCQATTPVVAPIVDQLAVDWQQFNLLEYSHGYNKYKIEFTPTIIFYKNGVEADRIVGEVATANSQVTGDMLKEWFQKHMAES